MKTTKHQTKWNTFVNASAAPGGATAGDLFSDQLELSLLKEDRVFRPHLKACPIHGLPPVMVLTHHEKYTSFYSLVCGLADCPLVSHMSDSDPRKLIKTWNMACVLEK